MLTLKNIYTFLLVVAPICSVQAAPNNNIFARDSKIKCGASNPKFPTAGSIPTQNNVAANAIKGCCNGIANRWLVPGDPYLCDVVAKKGDPAVTFSMHIITGGWNVPADFCVSEMTKVVNGCKNGGDKSWGGCATTEDGNVVSCIFP